MDILADSPLIPASFFWILCLRPTRHPRQVPVLLCHSGLCFVVYDDAVHGFLFPRRMPLYEQGIWQRRGLFLARFLSIFILGFRVLSSFSFRCSWYLVATGFVLWTVSFGTLFWSNLLSVTASFVVCSCLLP